MKRKVVIAVLIGFGAGLLSGSFVFPRNTGDIGIAFKPTEPAPASPTKTTTAHAAVSPGNGAATTAAARAKAATTPRDLEAFLGAGGMRRDLRRLEEILDGLPTNQLSEAIAICLKSTDSFCQYEATYEIATGWGEIDPQSALTFAQTFNDNAQRSQIMEGVMSGWVEQDPNTAIAFARQLPYGQLRNETVGVTAEAVATQNPQAAVALATSLPVGCIISR